MERLRSRDLAVLALESPTTPLHDAHVAVFEPGDSGFDHARLVALVEDRLAFVPRYRQRLQPGPGGLGSPVWVDDPRFDLGYHVRRAALPRPGSDEQLRDLTARIVSRPLDRTRPLWEAYLVEGLEGGRLALLTKSHQVLVDGADTLDLGQVLLDDQPVAPDLGGDDWRPRPAPGVLALASDTVRRSARHPRRASEVVAARASRTASAVGRRAADLTRSVTGHRPTPDSPVTAELSQQRRVVTVATDLAAYNRVREAHGGSVNDVVLATVTGALRGWLMTRTESLGGVRKLRALVPVAVIDDDLEATSLGSQVTGHPVDLPLGEASPVVRLHQVSYSFKAHAETGRAVAASRLAAVSGFAPPTFHALGTRVAVDGLRRGFHLTVTNVPGPQSPRYAAGARLVGSYPVPPLLTDHALAIGVTSYDGRVFYGITADRDAVPDAEVLGQCLREALDELLDSASDSRHRAPRGRAHVDPVPSGPAS